MQGWIVLRTAGSHGFADLIAINEPHKKICFIQVKTYKKSMTDKAILKMISEMPIEEGKYNVELKVL